MDSSPMAWLSDMGIMEEPFSYDQCDIADFFDQDLFADQGENFTSSVFQDANSNSSCFIPRSISTNTLCASTTTEASPPNSERPAKQRKTNNHNSSTIQKPTKNQHRVSSTPIILTFGNPTVSEINPQQVVLGSLNTEDDAASSEVLNSLGQFANVHDAGRSPKTPKKSGGRTRPPSQTYDHIIAERKRREQLSQRFVALSRLVPGLKKMDKSSVLGDTIKYLKQLQERVKELEEQSTQQRMESFVVVKRRAALVEDEGSSDEMCSNVEQGVGLHLPEIEARLCERTLLLRVHCHKTNGVLINLLSAVENLNLSITSTSFAPFGSLALDITIIAEMPKESNLTIKELVKALQSALQSGREGD